MFWVKSRLVSIFIIFIFLSNIILPDAYACWWKGLPSQNPEVEGTPTQGGLDDGKPNQPDDIADNVFLHNGDFVYTHQDLFIPSRGLNIEISRTYKSQSRFNGRFGLGWEPSYNKRVVPLSNGDAFYFDGEGGSHRFLYIDGTNYISPLEVFDKLVQNPDGTYSLTKKDGTKYNFNQNGMLSEVVDRNNNKLTFSYNPEGKLPIIGVPLYTNDPVTPRLIAYQYMLTKITDTVGREITFTYDTNGRLTEVRDFSGRTINYSYDNLGHLTSVTDPAGNITQYTYDSDRNLRSIIDPKSNTFLTNTYNPSDQVIAQTYGTNTFYFSYDIENRITQFTDRKGNRWIYYFDENGNPIGIEDPKGILTIKTYDANNKMLLTSVTYPRQNSILYEYDDKGNLTKVTRRPIFGSVEPDIVTAFTYEPNFNFIKTITDPKGNITTYDYDSKGNLIKITYPAVGADTPITTFTYNQYGQIETITDPNGVVIKYEYYPSTGYLKKVTNDFGDETHKNYVTEMLYDNVGNVTSITDARSNATTFEYNILNQLIKTISPAPFNCQTKYTYDKNGNLIKLERQANESGTQWQTTEYEYDILDQLIKTKQHLSDTEILTTQFQYDANGNRIAIIDAEVNTASYDYDQLNRLIKVTDALANATEYSYDENGNVKEIKDANANITTYTYDDFDRLIKTTYADNSFEEYTYDANSNLTTKKDPKNQTVYYAYDTLNRLTEKGLSPQGTVPESVVAYVYDKGSRLTDVIDLSGAIHYAYDALNRITAVTYPDAKSVAYEYDANSNRTKLVYPDSAYISYEYDQLNRITNIKDQTGASITSYQYDPLSRRIQADYLNNTQAVYSYDNVNRLLNLANKVNGGADISTFAYVYDNVGNRKTTTAQTGMHTYSYDNIYQLKTVDYPEGYLPSDTTFNYDSVGNRTSTVNGGTTSYASNNLNQYTQAGTTNYAYDLNGNLTGDGIWTYAYDYENRLVIARSGSDEAIYSYDAFGRRIQKNVNSATTKFLYDGDQIIAEYDGADTLLTKYIFGPGIDEPIKGLSPQGTVPEWFYHYDGLGSVTNLTDSSGATIESYSYDAFGKPSITSSIGNRFMFTGREYDSETGLYYYRARYYSPTLGRFLQRDPVGYVAGINLYTYCSNNPVNWIDPFGLDKQKKWEFGKWLFPIEIQVGFNPQGGYAAAYGPFVILYGPLYREQHSLVRESIRYHELIHIRQWGWGWRDIVDIIRKQPKSREIEAYKKQQEFIQEKIKSPDIDIGGKKALENFLEDVKWFIANPEYM